MFRCLDQGPAHIELAQLGPQDVFGEMSLLVGDARSASVTALTFVECVEVPKEAVRTVLLSHLQVNSRSHTASIARDSSRALERNVTGQSSDYWGYDLVCGLMLDLVTAKQMTEGEGLPSECTQSRK